VPLIRVAWNDAVMIKQVLDMGWDGVVVPQVNTADEARRAVSACRYPPAGGRGFGPRRAGGYYRDQDEYVHLANASVICVVQIERVDAADSVAEIVRVPGVDWIFVGRWDMSGSVGHLGEVDSAQVWDAVQYIFATARAAGIPAGNALAGTENIGRTLGMGCQLVMLGEDTGLLKAGVDAVVRAFHDARATGEATMTHKENQLS